MINQTNEKMTKAKVKIDSLRQKKKNLKIQLKASAMDEEQRRKYEDYFSMLEKQKNDLLAKHESSLT